MVSPIVKSVNLMKKPVLFILLILSLIISIPNCYSQEQRRLKMYLEGGYQFRNDNSYFLGIGVKMKMPLKCKLINYYNIHTSVWYEKYLSPDILKNDYALSSRVAYEFKFLLIGLSVRYINLAQVFSGNRYRIDLAPEFGIGYKYLWLTYSRDLLIYQKEKIPVSPDNFRVMINVPLFEIKFK